jgi:hypothetical protein
VIALGRATSTFSTTSECPQADIFLHLHRASNRRASPSAMTFSSARTAFSIGVVTTRAKSVVALSTGPVAAFSTGARELRGIGEHYTDELHMPTSLHSQAARRCCAENTCCKHMFHVFQMF